MSPFLRSTVVPCLVLLFGSRLQAQVLTRANTGLSTAEAIQVSGGSYYTSGALSAQDVDGDGRPDLFVSVEVANSSTPTTTLLHNTGNRNFQPASGNNSNYCVPGYTNPAAFYVQPPFCTLADLNRDSLPDKIFAGYTTTSSFDYPYIQVAYALGAGLYAPTVKYSVGGMGSFISAVATGDFNGDGRIDIAVLRLPQTSGSGPAYADIVLLLADGFGGFTVSQAYPTGVFRGGSNSETNPLFPQLASLDLNGDGRSDLIVYDGSGNSPVAVFFGAANGLSHQPALPFQNQTFQIEVAADLNHDGYGDLLVVENNGLHLLSGSPGGQYYGYFSRDQIIQPLNHWYGAATISAVAADFNGDGLPDLAVSTGYDVTIYVQQSDRTFLQLQSYPGGGLLATADFDGDGNVDVAVGGNPVNVLYGLGNGYFIAPSITANHGQPSSVVTADFNHDGIPDIATAWRGTCTGGTCPTFLSVFLGSGKGWFLPPVTYSIPYPSDSYSYYVGETSLVVGDVNGDGNPDVIALNEDYGASPSSNDTAVLLGKADGTFSPANGYRLGTQGNGIAYLRDMDNDGHLDLLVNNGIAYGNGDGTFASVTPYPVAAVQGFAVGDFNGDGKLDLLLNPSAASISVLLNSGHRRFTAGVAIAPPCSNGCTSGFSLAVGDLNGDGKLDFAALGNGELFTYLGNGHGTFTEKADAAIPSTYMYIPPYLPISIQDLNGDGINDVVLAPGPGTMPVLLGRGDGTLAKPLVFAVDAYYSYGLTFMPAFGDFNQDGSLDMAVPAISGVARLLNTGPNSWPALSSLPPAPAR